MRYDVYYDECKEDGYWHCFLFVPQEHKSYIYQMISRARECSGYNDVIHYSSLCRKAKPASSKSLFVSMLTDIFLYIIQQQKIDAVIDWKTRKERINAKKIGARLNILRHIPNENGQPPTQTEIEATFRMGIKGALHYLFRDELVEIDKVYVDFAEQPFNTQFHVDNLWERVKDELRDHVSYSNDSSILCWGKQRYTSDCQDSQIMQLVDVVIGSFRNCVTQGTDFFFRYKASEPIRKLIQKDLENHARMVNSRYYKGYSLTDVRNQYGYWEFRRMVIKDDKLQTSIFDTELS